MCFHIHEILGIFMNVFLGARFEKCRGIQRMLPQIPILSFAYGRGKHGVYFKNMIQKDSTLDTSYHSGIFATVESKGWGLTWVRGRPGADALEGVECPERQRRPPPPLHTTHRKSSKANLPRIFTATARGRQRQQLLVRKIKPIKKHQKTRPAA